MLPKASQPVSDVPIRIVGSNTFGYNKKISPEATYNMYISDEWLVDTPGYVKAVDFPNRINGRALYSSDRGNFMIAVIDNTVYKISGPNNHLVTQAIFAIDTYYGDVFIDENVASQIAICDQQDLWIYNFITGAVTKATLPVNPSTGKTISPGYVTYHDGYFIVPDTTSSAWYLSAQNDGTDWLWGAGPSAVAGSIQTKPDNAVAVLRAPGKGNLIYVFGRNVTEMWYDEGQQLFPYVRSNSVSIDYGCLSSTTIAAMDNYICWLGVNEKSGPVIMTSTGSGFTRLSTDGIDLKLAQVQFPVDSYAFFYKIDGHVVYQLTFFNPADNFTLLYDFNTQKFFYLTDENMNHHVAESVAFFNNTYYFIDINTGSVFELNSKYTTYDYTIPTNQVPNPNPPIIKEIPRMRICNTVRQQDNSRFIGQSLTFTIEQGTDPYFQSDQVFYMTGEDGTVITQEHAPGFIGNYLSTEQVDNIYSPRIDLSLSIDGGETFSNFVTQYLNPLGYRSNRMIFWKFGLANEMTFQLRFWSLDHVTVSNGVMQARLQGAEEQ